MERNYGGVGFIATGSYGKPLVRIDTAYGTGYWDTGLSKNMKQYFRYLYSSDSR